MKLVLDASAALYELVSPDGIEPIARANQLVAPALLWSEATSVLRETQWRGEISDELADLALGRLLRARIARRTNADVYARAHDVAASLGWAKTYDAEYVGLAQALEVPLYTRDVRLRRGAERLVEVVGPDEIARGRTRH